MREPGKFEGCPDQNIGKKLYLLLALDSVLGKLPDFSEAFLVNPSLYPNRSDSQQRVTADELGDAQDFNWYGLILDADQCKDPFPNKAYIVTEDSQGFFNYEAFNTNEEAEGNWAFLREDYEAFLESAEGDD